MKMYTVIGCVAVLTQITSFVVALKGMSLLFAPLGIILSCVGWMSFCIMGVYLPIKLLNYGGVPNATLGGTEK
jgi:hypothetical protein